MVDELLTSKGLYPLHPDILHLLKYFSDLHLPDDRQDLHSIAKPFRKLAEMMVKELQDCPDQEQVLRGLQKLIEAKDCFVRAYLF